MKSKLRLLVASLMTAALCGTASAQLDNFYVEGIAGFTSFKASTGDVTNNLFTQTAPATGTTANTITITGTDKSDMALGLRIGYQLTEIFSVEGSYINAGTLTISGTGQLNTPVLSASAVTFKNELEVTAWTFGFAAKHTMDKLSVGGRIGMTASRAEWGKTITTATIPPNNAAATAGKILQDAFPNQQRKADFSYGVSGSYKFNDRFTGSLNYDYVSGKQAASIVSASLKYAF
jgi:hypothetical protein